MKTLPSTMICTGTLPRAGSANWGKKARKKISTLGLVRFMTTPLPTQPMAERRVSTSRCSCALALSSTLTGACHAPQAR